MDYLAKAEKFIRSRLPSLKKDIVKLEKQRKNKWEKSRLSMYRMQLIGWEKFLKTQKEKK